MSVGKYKSWIETLLLLLAAVFMVLQCWYIAYVVLVVPQVYIGGSDYFCSFHPAGWLVAHGQADKLYPPLTAQSFAGAPFDVLTHSFLPTAARDKVFLFMYIPLVARMFAPLADLQPNIACLIWQSVNLLALFVSAFFLAGTAKAFGHRSNVVFLAGKIFLFSFFFLPVFDLLWLGQVDIIFAVLPMSAALYCLAGRQPFFGGLMLSLMILKLQFLPAAALMAVGYLFRRDWKVCAGLAVGLVFVALFTVGTMGSDVALSWLSSLRMSERLFSATDVRNPDYLAGCLPLAIPMALPLEMRSAVGPFIRVFVVAAVLGYMGILWMLSRKETNNARWHLLNMLIATTGLIIFSPRFLIYDWVILLVPMSLLVIFRTLFTKNTLLCLMALAPLADVQLICQLGFNVSAPIFFVVLASLYSGLIVYGALTKQPPEDAVGDVA